jgi:hypothetical protein
MGTELSRKIEVLSDIEQRAQTYVDRNLPERLPFIKKVIRSFIIAMERSPEIVSRLEKLSSFTDPSKQFNLFSELDSDASRFSDGRYTPLIAYSLTRKNIDYFYVVGREIVQSTPLMRYGRSLEKSITVVTDEVPQKYTDIASMTDASAYAIPIVVYMMDYAIQQGFDIRLFDEMLKFADELARFLTLTKPARVSACLLAVWNIVYTRQYKRGFTVVTSPFLDYGEMDRLNTMSDIELADIYSEVLMPDLRGFFTWELLDFDGDKKIYQIEIRSEEWSLVKIPSRDPSFTDIVIRPIKNNFRNLAKVVGVTFLKVIVAFRGMYAPIIPWTFNPRLIDLLYDNVLDGDYVQTQRKRFFEVPPFEVLRYWYAMGYWRPSFVEWISQLLSFIVNSGKCVDLFSVRAVWSTLSQLLYDILSCLVNTLFNVSWEEFYSYLDDVLDLICSELFSYLWNQMNDYESELLSVLLNDLYWDVQWTADDQMFTVRGVSFTEIYSILWELDNITVIDFVPNLFMTTEVGPIDWYDFYLSSIDVIYGPSFDPENPPYLPPLVSQFVDISDYTCSDCNGLAMFMSYTCEWSSLSSLLYTIYCVLNTSLYFDVNWTPSTAPFTFNSASSCGLSLEPPDWTPSTAPFTFNSASSGELDPSLPN